MLSQDFIRSKAWRRNSLLYRCPFFRSTLRLLSRKVCMIELSHFRGSLQRGLEFTADVQIALLAAGVATARALMEQDIEPAAVSGLSVGAFAAAVTAGVLSLRDAVELVRLRAERMMKLYPSG
jgi:acyl transferase domain-containing protein